MTTDRYSKYFSYFERFLPAGTALYCYQLWDQLNFEFKITKSRKTKLGDFRYHIPSGRKTITVNHDLNGYSFLITYLHEVAHLLTYKEYGSQVLPHGKEWKINFRKVSAPILAQNVLPPDVRQALENYLKNPKATSCSDTQLIRVLSRYNQEKNQVLLADLPMGEYFQFQNKQYRCEEKRRTRFVCTEIKTCKKFLISGNTLVKKLHK